MDGNLIICDDYRQNSSWLPVVALAAVAAIGAASIWALHNAQPQQPPPAGADADTLYDMVPWQPPESPSPTEQ